MSRPTPEVVDLVSSSEDENDERFGRDLKSPSHGKRAREVPYIVHAGRLAKKGGGKKVYPVANARGESAISRGAPFAQGQTDAFSCAQKQNEAGDASQHDLAARTFPVPWMFINADGSDNAIVTDGIMALAVKLQLPHVATCCGCQPVQGGVLDSQQGPQLMTSVLHIKQNDKFSCGFRNLQMMLSALVPHLPPDHPYFEAVPESLKRYPASATTIPTPLPSLRQLQSFLEQSWADGFDPKGAQHYSGRIIGKSSEIGAVEVSSCLSFLNIESTVVQFIKCKKSRSLLGRFVWAYFTKMVGRKGCCYCHYLGIRSSECASVQLPYTTNKCAKELLRLAAATPEGNVLQPCSCPVLPLYLQWEGHSVTIVGAERRVASNGSMSDNNLLLFDPSTNGARLKQSLSRAVSDNSTKNNKVTNEFLSSMRLPVSKLLQKDCQILMCSMRPLSVSEKMVCRGNVCSVTAAKSDVVRLLKK